jgi:glycosyltransferase involved in cell wall biosynthesis
MKSKSPNRVPTIFYLCLQATREGQASYAHVHEIIAGLRRRGWVVKLFEPSYARAKEIPPPLSRMIEFLITQGKLWISGKPHIIYIRLHFASWPTSFMAHLFGIPIILEVNGPYDDLFIAWPWTRRFESLFKWLMRCQLRWSDASIAVTNRLGEWCIEQGAKKVYVVPNGANTKLFHPDALPDPSLNLPSKYVIFFGALAPWQGIDTMLRAVNDPAWPRDVKLVFVGDGAERAKIEDAIQSNPQVRYLYSQPYRIMPGIIARSIASLSPQTDPPGGFRSSHTGVFPLKLFESLACGVPVIVTDIPEMADLVRENKCGLVIPKDNPPALARAVKYLYYNEKERLEMGKRGRQLVAELHSWDQRAEETAKVIRQVLNNL